MLRQRLLRHAAWAWLVVLASAIALPAAARTQAGLSDEIRSRFAHLSAHGNSNCSRQFMSAIPAMPADARLQGSCCSPMGLHRYAEQRQGLQAFAAIETIPLDPYDIAAPLAARLMSFYDRELTPAEQAAYDYAMNNSAEGGPCCCKCWRWHVYGGLAKHLIRDHQLSGAQIAKVWDLSDGCGGESHAH